MDKAITWGADIANNNERPSWLKDDDRIQFRITSGSWANMPEGYPVSEGWHYPSIDTIRLPADHPYYIATSKGFTYWAGGESAPVDWDGSDLLFRNGTQAPSCASWTHPWEGDGEISSHDVIGYRRKAELNAETVAAIDEIRARGFDGFESVGDLMDDLNDQVKIAKITRAEAYVDGLDIATLERLGLLRELSLIERFEAHHGGLDNNQRDIVAAYQEWVAGI